MEFPPLQAASIQEGSTLSPSHGLLWNGNKCPPFQQHVLYIWILKGKNVFFAVYFPYCFLSSVLRRLLWLAFSLSTFWWVSFHFSLFSHSLPVNGSVPHFYFCHYEISSQFAFVCCIFLYISVYSVWSCLSCSPSFPVQQPCMQCLNQQLNSTLLTQRINQGS